MSGPGPLPSLVLVDLDGTLVDTLPDIAFCVDGMLEALGLQTAGPERVRGWIGNGTEMLVRRALAHARGGEIGAADLRRALPVFVDLYTQHLCDRSRVYEGVTEGLDYMRERGIKLACVTNKADAFTTRLLAALDLDGYFPLVVSGDTLARRKPDPMPLLHAAAHFGVAPAEALLIGDSSNDVKAARAAGFRVFCVSYGYNHGEDIRASAPDAVIDTLAELPRIFEPRLRTHTLG